MNTANKPSTYHDAMAHDGIGEAIAEDNAIRDLARANSIKIDPEAYLFKTPAKRAEVLNQFFGKGELEPSQMQALLRRAVDADAHVEQLTDTVTGFRTNDKGVPLIHLTGPDNTVYLRYHTHADGGIHVVGWGTSPSAVAALPDGQH